MAEKKLNGTVIASEQYKSSNRERLGGGKCPSINGLRTYSAMCIVAMHVLKNIQNKPAEGFITTDVIGRMGELVLLFMMVSAFGMCCGYYERMKLGVIKPADFYKKRYVRVLPFFALLVCLDLVISPSWPSLAEAFSDVTLVFGLHPSADIKVIGVGWFLGTIFVFYMLFPFFVFLMDNKRRAWIVLAISLIWQLLMIHYYDAGSSAQILYSAPYFIVGGLIFLYKEDIIGFFQNNTARYGVLVIALALTLVFHVVPMAHQTLFESNLPRLVLYAVWLCYAIGTNDWLLNNKITAYLSDISMEIYLCHMVMFRLVEKAHCGGLIANAEWNYVLTFALTLTGAIVFAHVTKNHILKRISS